jgi:spore coat polysaccharide biosynthesis predicted glycosyltransferase SpsG
LEALGHECLLATHTPEPAGQIGWERFGWEGWIPDWFVFDFPSIVPEAFTEKYSTTTKYLVFDDYATKPRDCADITLNPCALQSSGEYNPRLLFGARYACIRREVREGKQSGTDGLSVFTSLGGDERELTAEIEMRLFDAAKVPVMSAYAIAAMRGADIAIVAGGVTALECAHRGIPMVLLQQGADQRMNIDGLAQADAALVAKDPAQAVELAAALCANAERRQQMSAAGRALIDGKGALRVAKEMERR